MSLIKLSMSGWQNAQNIIRETKFKNKLQNIKQNQFNDEQQEVNPIISSSRCETSPSTQVMF